MIFGTDETRNGREQFPTSLRCTLGHNVAHKPEAHIASASCQILPPRCFVNKYPSCRWLNLATSCNHGVDRPDTMFLIKTTAKAHPYGRDRNSNNSTSEETVKNPAAKHMHCGFVCHDQHAISFFWARPGVVMRRPLRQDHRKIIGYCGPIVEICSKSSTAELPSSDKGKPSSPIARMAVGQPPRFQHFESRSTWKLVIYTEIGYEFTNKYLLIQICKSIWQLKRCPSTLPCRFAARLL